MRTALVISRTSRRECTAVPVTPSDRAGMVPAQEVQGTITRNAGILYLLHGSSDLNVRSAFLSCNFIFYYN